MTYEEAIEMLKDRKFGAAIRGYADIAEMCELAIDALEKQIPKKPLHEHKNYYCPVCRENGWMLWDDAIPNDMDSFCGICGQAIDWGESE